ncbi:MAG TPA: acyltransferase family protein [Pseudonocardiaceae bacterium]
MSTRHLYLDNLKVVVIAAIIAVHAALSYTGIIEVWSYTEVREVTFWPVTEVVLLLMIAPFGFLTIPVLFLIAGLLTAPSLQRKGTARFVRDRLLRLGVPFVAYVLLVQPAVMYALEHPLGAAPRSYWYEFLGAERVLDTGPLWFVGVLLIFSLGLCGVDSDAAAGDRPRAWPDHGAAPAADRRGGDPGVVPGPTGVPVWR